MTLPEILVVGAGRMGRGIAQSYALGGHNVSVVDLKDRDDLAFQTLANDVESDLRADLTLTVKLGYLSLEDVDMVVDRVTTVRSSSITGRLSNVSVVYEALPETLELKRQAFTWINENVDQSTVVASTTSTLDVDELAQLIENPGRFLNAHWLNPAHLMPLVEVAVGSATDEEAYAQLHESLTAIGKVPVRCKASPGYIVPRIQALAMNEAARLVEEGVATAEDVDTAVRVGFGLRFAVLGLLEFIDWGGNDILYHASHHLARTVDKNRYKTPDLVESNMQLGRNGMREGVGFYDYDKINVEAYRQERLGKFLELVEHSGLLPVGLEKVSSGESYE